VKYADDTAMLVYPDQTEVSFADEFSNIKEWSKQNRLTINICKTKEIVFHRPNPIDFMPLLHYKMFNRFQAAGF